MRSKSLERCSAIISGAKQPKERKRRVDNILKNTVECTCEEFVAEVAGKRRKPYLDALKSTFKTIVLGRSTLVKDMSSFLRENEGKLERVSTGRRPPRRGRYGWCGFRS